jgi:hypothetical protein
MAVLSSSANCRAAWSYAWYFGVSLPGAESCSLGRSKSVQNQDISPLMHRAKYSVRFTGRLTKHGGPKLYVEWEHDLGVLGLKFRTCLMPVPHAMPGFVAQILIKHETIILGLKETWEVEKLAVAHLCKAKQLGAWQLRLKTQNIFRNFSEQPSTRSCQNLRNVYDKTQI